LCCTLGNALSFFEKNKLSNATVSPTLADFSLLPLRSMAERLVLDTSSSRKTFYSASDEPEPTDLIRVNLEASLLALAGKLQVTECRLTLHTSIHLLILFVFAIDSS
jgi:hypothetical protein